MAGKKGVGKGKPRPQGAGRKKGTPNHIDPYCKGEFHRILRERLEAERDPWTEEPNPLVFLHDVMCNAKESMPLRVRCAELLSAKLMPDLKAIEMQMDADVESRNGLSQDAVKMLRRILMGG